MWPVGKIFCFGLSYSEGFQSIKVSNPSYIFKSEKGGCGQTLLSTQLALFWTLFGWWLILRPPVKSVIVGVVASAPAALTTHSDLACLGFMSKLPPLVGGCRALSRKKRAVHEKLDQFLLIKMPDAQNICCQRMEIVLKSYAHHHALYVEHFTLHCIDCLWKEWQLRAIFKSFHFVNVWLWHHMNHIWSAHALYLICTQRFTVCLSVKGITRRVSACMKEVSLEKNWPPQCSPLKRPLESTAFKLAWYFSTDNPAPLMGSFSAMSSPSPRIGLLLNLVHF